MRLSKFLLTLLFITSLSLLYVYQQTEIFRLAYVGQKHNANCQDLLDKNSILRYTIKTKASLVQIGNRISKGTDYEIPDTYRLVRLSSSREAFGTIGPSGSKETLISRFFGIKRQAEAKTINSQ